MAYTSSTHSVLTVIVLADASENIKRMFIVGMGWFQHEASLTAQCACRLAHNSTGPSHKLDVLLF
jgi:hypothetical protein